MSAKKHPSCIKLQALLRPPAMETKALRDKFYNATLTEVIPVQEELWILRVKPDGGVASYKQGQYTTLGLGIWEPCVEGNGPEILKPNQEKQLLRRAYSVSHPILNAKTGKLYTKQEIDFYEFYVTLVLSDPKISSSPRLTPRLFALKKGARLCCGPKWTGHYNLDGIGSQDQVVFFATGTGEAPHNAMIWELLTRGHAAPIVSVVCTRKRRDQAYRAMHEKVAKQFSNYQVIYLATREAEEPKLYCQDLIAQGLFEKKTGVKLDPINTHVFLCGNPSMIGRPEVKDNVKVYPAPSGIIEILENRGFTINTPTNKSGNIHFEAYW